MEPDTDGVNATAQLTVTQTTDSAGWTLEDWNSNDAVVGSTGGDTLTIKNTSRSSTRTSATSYSEADLSRDRFLSADQGQHKWQR
jgi:hypothetical protein